MKPSFARKRVAIILAGNPSITPAAFRQWVDALPEMGIIADVVPLVSRRREAKGLTSASITGLAETVASVYAQANGCVIIHTLDHLLYTAAALSFMLSGLGKPVIVTGSEEPEGKILSHRSSGIGLKANVINAVQAATLPIPEVAILFGNRLVRANAAFRSPVGEPNVFSAPPSAVLGRIDFSIRLQERNYRPTSRAKLAVSPIAQRVEYLVLTPWLDANALRRHLATAQALLLDARQCQTLPPWLYAWLQSGAVTRPVAILVAGNVGSLSHRNVAALPMGTPQAMLAKLAWATAVAKKPAQAAALMAQNIAGEFSV